MSLPASPAKTQSSEASTFGDLESRTTWYNNHMKVKKLDYLIKLTYDKTYKGYVADVVNLYGCMSQGKTKEEALENAEKAIKAYMEAVNTSDKGGEFTSRSVDIPFLY